MLGRFISRSYGEVAGVQAYALIAESDCYLVDVHGGWLVLHSKESVESFWIKSLGALSSNDNTPVLDKIQKL